MGLAQAVGSILALAWTCVPSPLRRMTLKGMIYVEGRVRSRSGVTNLLQLWPFVEKQAGGVAMRQEGGIHPKHRLIGYHEFFIDRIHDGEVVLDVGCGVGVVASSIVARRNVQVFGIDLDPRNIAKARRLWRDERLHFVEGDATKSLPVARCDVVVFSNVLEHIDSRVGLLEHVIATIQPRKILIRVPVFERHWIIPFMKEKGLQYFSDATHVVEHTRDGWLGEFRAAGLRDVHWEVCWGELWCECVPLHAKPGVTM